jgi:hypothetical protein
MQEKDFSTVLCSALSWLQIDKMNTLSKLFYMPSDSIQNIIHDLDEHIQDVSPKEAFLILKYLNTIVKNNWIIYNVTVRRRLGAYRTGVWYFELWDFMVRFIDKAHKCENIAVPRQVFPSNTFGICFGLFQGKMARVFSLEMLSNRRLHLLNISGIFCLLKKKLKFRFGMKRIMR